ncbi:MAG: DNA-formamidopyrimidine glycosylase family protein, partial [Anaerolineae bacterium]
MFECPEVITISRQMREALPGKRVIQAQVLTAPHKFAFLNRPAADYAEALTGAELGVAFDDGANIYLPCSPGRILVFGEVVGRLLYHAPGAKLPERHQLLLHFSDDSALSLTISMWAALQLIPAVDLEAFPRWSRRRPGPLAPDFTWEYFV